MLTPDLLARVQRALTDAELDGWLLYDFRGTNPIAAGLMGLEGMTSRRVFAWLPSQGTPVAITHAIEQGPWRRWPSSWRREIYSSWRVLEGYLASLVAGKRIAMEYSPGDAVPYLDRIPAGVLEMVRAAGATVVPSGELVSRFYAAFTPAQVALHTRTAEVVATVANDAMRHAGAETRAGRQLTEHALQQWIVAAFDRLNLDYDHPPIVGVGANAANPHYEPLAESSAPIQVGDTVLIDLWAREKGGAGIWADQTWMMSIGSPSARAIQVWEAVRDGRDAAIALLRDRVNAGQALRGAELDDAARGVITARGFGDRFTHRTGHSIDAHDLHGSGPHLDNLETREERLLIDGVAFSIEPGVYITGEIGVRSEVNAVISGGDAIVTPQRYQTEMLVV